MKVRQLPPPPVQVNQLVPPRHYPQVEAYLPRLASLHRPQRHVQHQHRRVSLQVHRNQNPNLLVQVLHLVVVLHLRNHHQHLRVLLLAKVLANHLPPVSHPRQAPPRLVVVAQSPHL